MGSVVPASGWYLFLVSFSLICVMCAVLRMDHATLNPKPKPETRNQAEVKLKRASENIGSGWYEGKQATSHWNTGSDPMDGTTHRHFSA